MTALLTSPKGREDDFGSAGSGSGSSSGDAGAGSGTGGTGEAGASLSTAGSGLLTVSHAWRVCFDEAYNCLAK